MSRSLRGSVVVITGASSGIGRAAALAFARRGASVVLAARRADLLTELAAMCVSVGGRALAVPLDVSDEAAVRELARVAVEVFGRIDVWVNNAGVAMVARVDEAPYDALRRVIDVNLMGYVHGARAALPYFRAQGSGVLINNASILGVVGAPSLGAYVIAKFGIVGLGESLSHDLLGAPDIHICTLMPLTIDTPMFQHVANFFGRVFLPIPPVYRAELVAEAMVSLALRPRRRMYVPANGRLAAIANAVAPRITARVIAQTVERYSLQDVVAPPTPGNLFAPLPIGIGISGGWRTVGRLSGFFRSAAMFARELPGAIAVRMRDLRIRSAVARR